MMPRVQIEFSDELPLSLVLTAPEDLADSEQRRDVANILEEALEEIAMIIS